MRIAYVMLIVLVLQAGLAHAQAAGDGTTPKPLPPARAVAKAFPAMDVTMRASLASLLSKLGEGQTVIIAFGGVSASFTRKDELLSVDVRAGMPALAQLPVADPQALPGAADKPWTRPGATAGEEIVGPDGGRYVWVPPGEFMMGSADAELELVIKTMTGDSNWIQDEKPLHPVKITRGFWIGRFEVIDAQYRAFCEAAQRVFPPESNQGDDHPVVNVSWSDAKAYCDHYGLRLPTEAEWEYAARGEQGVLFPWGNDWDAVQHCSAGNAGPGGTTFPVGTFPEAASWCGDEDMVGNVWEWCADWYDPAYYANCPEADPKGPAAGEKRVFRGGSCRGKAWISRTACRNKDVNSKIRDRGFRAVIEPD